MTISARGKCGCSGGAIPFLGDFDAFAKQLLAMTAGNGELTEEAYPVTFRASDRLSRPLSTLAGKKGLYALLSRAVTITKADFPRLNPVEVDDDGRLVGLADIHPHLSSEEAAEAEAAIIANLLKLLSTFVGETLTLRIVKDAWPDAFFSERQSGEETEA